MLSPSIPQSLKLAVQQHTAGRIGEAEVIYERILRQDPDNADALHLLGIVAYSRGEHDRAVELIRRAIDVRRDSPEFHNNLGEVLRASARPDAAAESFREAIRLNPTYLQAHNNLGAALAAMEKRPEAIDAFRAALRLKPDYIPALRNLATACVLEEKHSEAAQAYRELLRRTPMQAIDLHMLGIVLLREHRYQEALEPLRRAVQLDSNFAAAWSDLAIVHKRLGNVSQMEAACRAAVARTPDNAQYHWYLSMALLEQGNFAEGLDEHEWRLATPQFRQLQRNFRQPRWDGSDLRGKTLYVQGEQGIGDSIQFARYLPMAAQRGVNVIFAPQPHVMSLMQSVRGVSQVVSPDAAPPAFDAHIALMSLPRIFKTDLETIPAAVPYLAAPPAAVERWRDRLAPDRNLRVGLVWAGSPLFQDNRNRSASLSDFAPLARVPGVTFYSLQKGPAAQQLKEPGAMKLVDLGPELTDFNDSAAVLENLDLLISTDTAIVHLAGALARPVWTLLAHSSDWRWLRDREDSPWYPTMRLLRQKNPGDWRELLERTARELELLTESRQPR